LSSYSKHPPTVLVPTTFIPMENTHTDSHEFSSGYYIASFLILLLILGFFGDLFIFILGTIGLVIAYASYFSSRPDHEDDHH
jgi:uncharacterized membrane protein